MRHLKKISNHTYEEFNTFLAKRFEEGETDLSSQTIDSVGLYKTRLKIKLKIRRSIYDISSGINMEFPATVQLRTVRNYCMLELNLDITRIWVYSLIFVVLFSAVMFIETPLFFSIGFAIFGGAILFFLLYYKTQKGLKEYADSLVDKV
ncbi:MAG: hypothetical protein MK105_19080 [Crocinitomicaceae bacterium]|nr:hypothetical protein [Crocinitomicaceae bacterium]